jgi:hypothetical protein
VVGDATLELTLSQFWSSLGSSSIEVEVSFFGLSVEPVAAVAGGGGGGSMVLDAAAGPLKVRLCCLAVCFGSGKPHVMLP